MEAAILFPFCQLKTRMRIILERNHAALASAIIIIIILCFTSGNHAEGFALQCFSFRDVLIDGGIGEAALSILEDQKILTQSVFFSMKEDHIVRLL